MPGAMPGVSDPRGATQGEGSALITPTVPVHPHFADPVASQLAENGAARIHPFPGPATTKGAFELGGEPGTRDIHFAAGKGDLRLVVGDLLPVTANGFGANQRS